MVEKFTDIELMTIAVALFAFELDIKKAPLSNAVETELPKIRELRHKVERMFGFDYKERGEKE